MKKITLMVMLVLLCISVQLISRDLSFQNNYRKLECFGYLEYSNISLRVSNFGWVGKVTGYPSGVGLGWPNITNEPMCDHLFQASLWVGGQKYRRNSLGQLLYWLPDAQGNNDVITDNDPEWTPDLEPVLDTLTTCGYDGDLNLYEFLPAYNPLETNAIGELYSENNSQDAIIKDIGQSLGIDDDGDGLIDEDNLGRPFNYDDPLATWCFTEPYDEDGDGFVDEDWSYPGYETLISYSYDYSPFGTATERDWGNDKGFSDHYPLRLAVESQTFGFPFLGLENVVFSIWRIHNTSSLDSLKYMSYGLLVDADIGPVGWENVSDDDVSVYNDDPSYDFAYSYDYDGDGGIAESKLAGKIIDSEYGVSCWTWNVGDGPDDTEPLEFNPSVTANEKYWLLTNRNPDEDDYVSLKEFPDAQVSSGGLDTRFLYSVYGAMPHTGDQDENGEMDYLETDEYGDYYKRFDLAPLDYVDIAAILFVGNDNEELEAIYNEAIAFVESGFDITEYLDNPSIPIINSISTVNHFIHMEWLCFSESTTLWVKYKQIDEPAADWVYIELEPGTSEYTFSEITQADYYELQVAVEFGDVYLESRKEIYFFDPSLSEDENEIALLNQKLINYPNPFNPRTTIHWQQEKSDLVSLAIYNLKGQKINDLAEGYYESGRHFVSWDGKNTAGEDCPSGIYLIRLQTGDKITSRRIMLLK